MITRKTPSYDNQMIDDENGEYVKYSDHVKRIEELEKALTEIQRVANFPPVDKIISELARQALNKK